MFQIYKIPLVIATTGILFLVIASIYIIKNISKSPEIIFETNASQSSILKIKIDIEGAVMTPGIYELPWESRIADALTAAGGLSPDADRDYVSQKINRAAQISDGSKLYIPRLGESKDKEAGTYLSGETTPVNLNSSAKQELESLPGIGPVFADKIISGRPYSTIEDLISKKILSAGLFDKIKDKIIVY